MNKYQKSLLSGTSCSLKHCEEKVWTGGKFSFKQNEDITLKDYVLCISNPSIEAVFAMDGDAQTPFEEKEGKFCSLVDFDHKIDSIKIVFKNGLADDLIVPVEYVEADREAYYAQKEKERNAALLTAAAIKCATGSNLVNIYFQPCCDEYEYTEIQLYIPQQVISKGWTSEGRELYDIPAWSFIKKTKVNPEEFYASIGGLAYGKYAFVLKQFNKGGNILLTTDYIGFSISI